MSRFNMSVSDFIEYLRHDPNNFANSTEEMLDFLRIIAKKADAALPPLFGYKY